MSVLRWILKKGVDGKPSEKVLQIKMVNKKDWPWEDIPIFQESSECYLNNFIYDSTWE